MKKRIHNTIPKVLRVIPANHLSRSTTEYKSQTWQPIQDPTTQATQAAGIRRADKGGVRPGREWKRIGAGRGIPSQEATG